MYTHIFQRDCLQTVDNSEKNITDISYIRDARTCPNYRVYVLLKNKHSSYCIYIYKNYNREIFGSVGTGEMNNNMQ